MPKQQGSTSNNIQPLRPVFADHLAKLVRETIDNSTYRELGSEVHKLAFLLESHQGVVDDIRALPLDIKNPKAVENLFISTHPGTSFRDDYWLPGKPLYSHYLLTLISQINYGKKR